MKLKNSLFLLVVSALAASAISMSAQNSQVIKGTVVSEDGKPLPGVVVLPDGGKADAAVTDENGAWTVNAAPSSVDGIEVSCLGFITVREQVGGRSVINIIMKEDTQLLDEVVVVGYGVQKKGNLTGSVTQINFNDAIESRPAMTTSSALAGLSAGLQVRQTSGQPGEDSASLRIRGNTTLNNNSPLVLVDGVEWSMDDVNPADIESVTVLKDASSTAIYGSRAANGVILITTKKGSGKASVAYSVQAVMQTPYNKIGWLSDYATHMELVNEAADNVDQAHLFSDSTIAAWKAAQANPDGVNEYGVKNSIAYPNTDWFKELFSTGFSQEHNVSVQGSSEKVRYLVSLGYLDNNGVMTRFKEIDSGTNKFNIRTNVEAKVTNWLTMGARIFGQKQDYGLANVKNAFSYIYQTTPGIYPGEPDKWGRAVATEEHTSANNIFAQMAGPAGHKTTYRMNASLYGVVNLYKGLTFEATGNYAQIYTDQNTYARKNGMWNYMNDTRFSESNLANANNSNSYSMNYRINTEMLLRYNNTFAEKHEVGALAGFTTNYYKQRAFSVSKKGAADWSISEMDKYTDYDSSSSSTAEWSLMSWFGRVNYAYDSRYLVEANFRADGSSRFSPKSRWGFFPSFSAGWRINQEEFMQEATWLSNLKLRASWGITGNNNVGNYSWQSTYQSVKIVTGGAGTTGFVQKELGNDNLEWETTHTTNVGLDFGIFDNILTAEMDFYVKNTSGILYRPTVYETMGNITGAYANLAAVRNTGFELTLAHNNTIGKDFRYGISLNLGYNKGIVTKYQGQLQQYWTEVDGKRVYVNNLAQVSQGSNTAKILEGHVYGEHLLYQVYKGSGRGYTGGEVDVNAGPKDGMIRTEADMAWVKAMIDAGYSFRGVKKVGKDQLWYGDLLYQDVNGDKNYGDSNDQVLNGHTNNPLVNAGLSLNLSWKGIDFSAVFSGAFGFWLNWGTQYYNTTKVTNGHGIARHIAADHYFYDPDNLTDSRTNIHGKNPRLTLNDDYSNAMTSDFREYRGDYVKLKNVQIGYTLPQNISRKIAMQKFRVFISAENLFTITKYPGLDPEIGTTIGYPLMRSVSLGAQISF